MYTHFQKLQWSVLTSYRTWSWFRVKVEEGVVNSLCQALSQQRQTLEKADGPTN